ncbi:MAG: tRNA uridine(34) 5-carboxymethylaminomethyl modification radical SAM/GNAT enzyme Elp3 [Patescibacteria group bacterium]|jgi:elongator complex protein 3
MDQVNTLELARDLHEARPQTMDELHRLQRVLAKKYGRPISSHTTLLGEYRQFLKDTGTTGDEKLVRLLRKRSIRTLSGVAPITVLTKPYPCPGRCVYCPTERNMPKSYIASEPAAARALGNAFDPYKQTKSRIETLEGNGHTADKIELIVLGGTWSFYEKAYQEWFIKRCFDAANGVDSATLGEAHKMNETAERRIIGVTLETRPDYVTEEELWRMRLLGCTHVQIGVQTLDQAVLDLIKRDDTVESMMHATRLLKKFGFKFTFHIMPGLPGATPASDLETFDALFTDERFQPDMLKIYPTVVVQSSILYHWWKAGKYVPYDDETLRNLLIEIKRRIPPYVRINRLIRDIPGNDIIDGNLVTNLRQMLQEQGISCRCIRCRESRSKDVDAATAVIKVRSYPSSGGTEYFISMETEDESTIFAFVRLHLPPDETTAFVRELHTYGQMIPVGSDDSAVQHIGFGKQLMKEAERIASENGRAKLSVISGVGVREYYRKMGYRQENTYMVKELDN